MYRLMSVALLLALAACATTTVPEANVPRDAYGRPILAR